jgi:hypothetical protein
MAWWLKRFYKPVILPDQRSLLTLRDVAEHIATLPPSDRNTAHWQLALESLTLAANTKGSIELARTAVMALNRARH